jgi:hypothetical protein
VATDVAWIDVLPTGKGFIPALDKIIGSAMPGAGKRAGDQYGKAFSDSAAAKIEASSDRVVAAQRKAEDAAGRHSVALSRLQDLVAKGTASASQLAAANEAVARSSRTVEAAHDGVSRAQANLKRTQDGLNESGGRFTEHVGRLRGGLLGLEMQSRALDRTSQGLSRSVGIMGTVGVAAFGALGSQAVVGGVLGLAGAVGTASGAILLLPAAAVAVAAPLATFKLGLIGVDDAFKALADGKMDKFEEALAKMAPSAAATFREIATLKPAFDDLRQSIQQNMFEGLAQYVAPLGATYFPVLREELGRFGTIMGGAAQQVARFALEGRTVGDLAMILANVRSGFAELAGAAVPALQIFRDLAAVGSTFMPGLASGLTDLAWRTAEWVARARETGVLRDIMSAALSVIGDLGVIVMNVGSIIVSVFQAGAGSGAGFLEIIKSATGELAAFLNTDYGQSMLAGAFAAIGEAIRAVMPLIGIVAGIVIGQLVPAFAGLGLQLAPIAQVLLVQLGYAIGQLTPILPLVGEAIIAIVNAFIPWIPLLTQAAVTLLPIFLSLITALAPVIVPLAGAIFVMVQAVAAYNAIMTLASIAGTAFKVIQAAIWITTTAWTAAQWLLNAALAANPITLVVLALVALGAALVLAWNNSETFRSIVTAAWNGIKDAASAAWNGVIKPVIDAFAAAGTWLWNVVLVPAFNGILAAWNAVSNGLKWAWDNIIKPTWDFLLIAAQYLLTFLAVVIFAPILIAWNLLSAGMKLAYDNIILPLWNALQAAARFMWENVLRPVWDAVKAAWDYVAQAFVNAYNNWILPMWHALQDAARWMWENVLRPVWDAVKAAWDYMAQAFVNTYHNIILPMWNALQAAARWMWENVLRPIWDAMKAGWEILGNFFRWVYDKIIQPAWDAVARSLTWLKDRFNDAVNWIRDIWNGIKRVLAVPINFMINTVWNKGIVPAWNAVAALLPGVGKINPQPGIAEAATGGQFTSDGVNNYRAGGQLQGRYRGDTADNLLGIVDNKVPIKVNPLEWIHPVKAVRKYGPDFMKAVQKGQYPAELAHEWEHYAAGGQVPSYATGNQIFAVTKAALPKTKLNSTYRPGSAGYHGRNQAADMGEQGFPGGAGRPYMGQIKRFWYDNFGRTANEIIYNGIGADRPNSKDGRNYPYSSTIQAQHRDHVHVAMAGNIVGAVGAALLGSAVDLTEDIVNEMKRNIAKLFGPARAAVNTIGDKPPPAFNDVPRKMGNTLIDKALEFFNLKAEEHGSAMSAVGGNVTSGPVVDQVRSVAAARGWGSGPQWDALDWIVRKESAWNPSAKNPKSTASGLFQMIDGTWRAYRPPNGAPYATARQAPPSIQAMAGMNYFGGRYGSPAGAKAFWQRNGWYAAGGQIPASVFDAGGLWRAGTLGFNAGGSGRGYRGRTDERVLTAPQDNSWRQFVRTGDAMLRELGQSGGGGRKVAENITIHAEGPDAALQAVDKLYRKIRMHDRGGVHSNLTTFST